MLSADVQRLEPGGRIQLIEVDCTAFGGDVLRFHAYNVPHSLSDFDEALAGSTLYYAGDARRMAGATVVADQNLQPRAITWQGEEYHAWPYEIEGLDVTGDGRAPTPQLSVGNVGHSISALCLYLGDLVQAPVRIHRTAAHYLDAANFADGNPQADPTQETVELWFINQKTGEDDDAVQWDLASPSDLTGIMIPTRQIHSLCTWCLRGEYRGADCGYTGPPVSDATGNPTDDPAMDQCGGQLSDCKARFGEHSPLSFGGCPGAALLVR